MSSSSDIHEYPLLTRALRRLLKARGLVYRDVARALGVAESTIKRVLTAGDGSVARLVDICRVADVAFRDLVDHAHAEGEPRWTFTPEQEAWFMDHPAFFHVFAELYIRGRQPDEVQAAHGLTAGSLRGYLEQLEHMGLLEVAGRRRVRMLRRGALAFRPGSPLLTRLQRDLAAHVVAELTAGGEGDPRDRLLTREWRCAPETLVRLTRELEATLETMERDATRDEALLPAAQRVPVTFLGGLVVGRSRGPEVPELPAPGARRGRPRRVV